MVDLYETLISHFDFSVVLFILSATLSKDICISTYLVRFFTDVELDI
jgi:hypothetical protein